MLQSLSFKRFAVISVVALMGLAACRHPFQVRVTDFRGGASPSFFQGESLKMGVHWDQEDANKAVRCQLLDTNTGESKWEGGASVPVVENGSLETLAFDPPLPSDGQLGLTAGAYQWTCDLEEYGTSGVYFDIVERFRHN